MNDIQPNLSVAGRGWRLFLAINGAFCFGFTRWFWLIPVLFYLMFTAMSGFCLLPAAGRRLWRRGRGAAQTRRRRLGT